MANRTVEDRLREEYFNLLPEIRQVAEHLEVTIRHQLLKISGPLELRSRRFVHAYHSERFSRSAGSRISAKPLG
jgi:hypothetical protein